MTGGGGVGAPAVGRYAPRRLLAIFGAGAIVATALLPLPASAAAWTRRYIDALPDSAFAAVERTPAGVKRRHLPHHDRAGHVDLRHVRSALARLPQVHWVDPRHAAAARAHLQRHLEAARRRAATPRHDSP